MDMRGHLLPISGIFVSYSCPFSSSISGALSAGKQPHDRCTALSKFSVVSSRLGQCIEADRRAQSHRILQMQQASLSVPGCVFWARGRYPGPGTCTGGPRHYLGRVLLYSGGICVAPLSHAAPPTAATKLKCPRGQRKSFALTTSTACIL